MITTERRALILSAVMALTVGTAGVSFSILTNSRAILLDGLFNITYSAFALATVRVAQLAVQPDNEEFPWGYAYFESLVNAGKGLLILGVSAGAFADSLLALFAGGRLISAPPAIGYGVFATVACIVTALLMREAHRHDPTPLVRVDVENWTVNSMISGAVLLAFCIVPVARALGLEAVTPYVDPFLVTAIVLLSLEIPVRIAWRAIMELLDRAPPKSVTQPIHEAIDTVLASLPISARYVRVIRPGRMLFVTIHIVLPRSFPIGTLATLDKIREEIDSSIRRIYPRVITDVLFTGDQRWAAPSAGSLQSK